MWINNKQMFKSRDGIYHRCPNCNTEIYSMAVLAFSKREAGCSSCGKLLPKQLCSLGVSIEQENK